jgi:Domain of unknown function (DUF4440)
MRRLPFFDVHVATRSQAMKRAPAIVVAMRSLRWKMSGLKNEHNAAELEHILASDFLHPVVTGDVLTKAQHIEFSSKHLPHQISAIISKGLQVRVYGDVGIVNGLVVTTNKDGNTVDKTVFTDIFVYRDGRWQAVNAQENAARKVDKP